MIIRRQGLLESVINALERTQKCGNSLHSRHSGSEYRKGIIGIRKSAQGMTPSKFHEASRAGYTESDFLRPMR
jgi:hypothetical protein